ncbi:MBL fold metallo-hydrolase [Halorubrum sp. Atlit-8R]|uniref:MBL fold metallo-hydrolase n=1 Tax=unclassified Halorubrum TaxID=2642239 RepID=UPI000EF1EF09|nr:MULTISPECIES: MBL fold metallo-hydrolase [unclassified Halorubrum]RLM63864.1 MBL fold metallo-hydrolase [Halorubrum sp. Atlit-9R]RLM77243.1 MBL fold metallo-hydrolase [Halorubrum sp. Atlit-8R]
MELTVLGSGSAMPVPDRAQAGYLLDDGDRSLLVDCGSGVLGRLAGTDTGYEGASTVLLTHHHLDHVADLLPLVKARWLAGEEHLEVVGPAGTKSLVDDLLDVHDYLDGRIDLAVREVSAAQSFTAGGFDVTARETRHSMDGFAYRFSPPSSDAAPGDGPLALSGDTEAFAGMAPFADGADCLVHDCSFPDDVDVSNHPTPTSLGESLAGAAVGTLLLSHLYPHTGGREREMVEGVRDAGFDGEVRVAADGLRVSL